MTDENKKDESSENSGINTSEESVQAQGEAKDPWTTEAGAEDHDAAQSLAANADQKEKDSATASNQSAEEDGEFQRDLINRLAFASLNEQRRTRRWGIFFKTLVFIYLFGILLLYFPEEGGDIAIGSHTAMVEVSGVIADNQFANADNIITGLRDAFENRGAKGVILRINSPGGSPVQAGYVYDEIVRLREKYPSKPLYAVVTEMCASAAYYIAAASDAIYADKSSIVGSIGVLMDGYGFADAIKKLGVERRLLTAGEHKGFLDPFSPLKPEHRRHMQSLLNNVHEQFIDVVRQGRGERLSNDPDIFSGLFWTGEKSIKLGLVDGLGSASYVARELVGEKRIVDYTLRPNYFDRFAERIGVAMANSFQSVVGGFQLR